MDNLSEKTWTQTPYKLDRPNDINKVVLDGSCPLHRLNGPHKYRVNGESSEMREFFAMFGSAWSR